MKKSMLMTPDNTQAVLEDRKTQTRRLIVPQPEWMGQEGIAAAGWSWRHGFNPPNYQSWPDADVFGMVMEKHARYKVGDIVVLRTTWAVLPEWDSRKPSEIDPAQVSIWFWFTGCGKPKPPGAGKSRPGRFLPKTLWHYMPRVKIAAVRAQRLQDISEADAIAEGVAPLYSHDDIHHPRYYPEFDLNPMPYANYLWHGHVGKTITRKQADAWDYQYPGYDTAVGSFSSLWDSINAKRSPWTNNDWVFAYTFERVKP